MHHRWKYTSAQVPLWNGGGGGETENEKMFHYAVRMRTYGVRKKLDHFCSYFSHIEFNKIEIFY